MREAPGRVGVVGLGLMGASFALALRARHPEVEIVGVDTDPHTVRRAVQIGAADTASPDPAVLDGSDLIVLAVPVGAMRTVLREVAPYAARSVVTDMASTKAEVMRMAAEAGVDLVGGHPMTGSEKSGVDAADPNLFRGARWLLTRHDPRVDWAVRAVGGVPQVIEPARHDRLVAGVSHAAFMVSAAFVLALADSPDWPDMAGLGAGGYRDMSRLAVGDPAMYAGIASSNAAEIAAQLEAVERRLEEMRSLLSAPDADLEGLFRQAREIRLEWQRLREEGS